MSWRGTVSATLDRNPWAAWLWIPTICLLLAMPCFASERAHVVFIAIDDSGSMKTSDPQRIRLEAASMLAASATGADQLGIVRFGDDAAWLVSPAPLNKTKELDAKLQELRSSDQHTDFAAPLRLILNYLDSRGDYFKNYDVSLVLMTDGAPDPGPQYRDGPDQNRREALQISKALSTRGVRVFTVGLGAGVESDFLKNLAIETDGSYAPARTAEELRDAFLKTVTRIFSLPAYEQIQGLSQATVHVGPNPEMVRAYLFRKSSGTVLAGDAKQFFVSEHIAAYDLAKVADIPLHITGPIDSASIVICVRQPLTFREERAVAPALLVDSSENLQVRLLGSGEPQWGRLFMRDATVTVRLRSAGQVDIIGPLYPDPNTKSYRGTLPTDRAGEFDASVRMESAYGAAEYFLAKLTIAATAINMPPQVAVEYPSFLPTSMQRLFGTKVELRYLLPSGSARVAFEAPSTIALSAQNVEIAAGESGTFSMFAAAGNPAGTVVLPYIVTWDNGQQQQVRRGVIAAQFVQQGPLQFVRRHWIAFAGIVLVITLAFVLLPNPTVKGVLVIEQVGAGRKRVVLDTLKAKRVTVAESSGREVLTSVPVLVLTGSDRQLFTLTMVKAQGTWVPQVDRAQNVPLETPATLKQGSKIAVKDRDITFTFYQG